VMLTSVRVAAVVADHVCTFQTRTPKLFERVGLNVIPSPSAVLIVSF
jgi:hypothetical protein